MTNLPCDLRKRTVSPIIARFSSSVVCSTSRTWSGDVLPKIVTTGVAAAISSWTCSSAATATSLRRVDPNAARRAFLNVRCFASAKNSMSLGLHPGFFLGLASPGLRGGLARLDVTFRKDPETRLLLRRDQQKRQVVAGAAKGDAAGLRYRSRHAIAAAAAAPPSMRSASTFVPRA